ncbi:hypothetical protein [Endozoicomonas sp.]|uniref:hypothetical protein n=1 Tax=Endozoicomonas sp. TaxID=1892382 RepID=UPI002884C3FB|nr:hypothetical protein [Endozoicomonas sp.]
MYLMVFNFCSRKLKSIFMIVFVFQLAQSGYSVSGKEYNIEVFARFYEAEIPINGGRIYKINWVGELEFMGLTDEYGILEFLVSDDLPFSLFIDENTLGYLPHKKIFSGLIELDKKNGSVIDRVTFQVPLEWTYLLIKHSLSLRFNTQSIQTGCHVVTTVTSTGETFENCPHGLEGVSVSLMPSLEESRYYFDMMRVWPVWCKTDMVFNLVIYSYFIAMYNFSKPLLARINNQLHVPELLPYLSLDRTSRDGGVIFVNVPAREKPYFIQSSHPHYIFPKIKFICRPDTIINISPPQGPRPLRVRFKPT